METPSSTTRRATRSQTLAALNNSIPISRRIEDSEISVSKSTQRATKRQQPQQDRSALIDITNDSPIVGLANGGLETPSSAVSKHRTIRDAGKTPGSGETLLRCQVKTLLQKVEEEADLCKISLESRPFLHLQGFVNSPMRLLAPTPANTPQILNISEDDSVSENGLASTVTSPVIPEQMISQVVGDIFDGKMEESIESDTNLISRSLLLDFSEKKMVIDEGQSEEGNKESPYSDEDDSSVWSIQVNASIHDDEQVVGAEEEAGEENEAGTGGLLDELCEEMSKITIAKFTGSHTRFVYNSDDEFVEEPTSGGVSPKVVLRLKGLPTPKGKHIRFANDD